MKNYLETLLFLVFFSIPLSAEITVDGSLGGSQQQILGPNYAIEENLGQREGHNLFHSFSTFNINTNEQAEFVTHSATNNIFARVTGGNFSTIDGIISTNSTANLWLMNPAGWVIGKNAQLNVQGAFHLSSAHGIGFDHGDMFFADPMSESVLSAKAPIDYQFNQDTQAKITLDHADLVMSENQDITLLGGDISMQNSTIDAPGGQVVLASNSGEGQWKINSDGLAQIKGNAGNIDIIHDTQTNILSPSIRNSDAEAGISNGGIQLTANKIQLTNATIFGEASNNTPAGNTLLHAPIIRLTDSSIISEVKGNKNAGLIEITGHDLFLDRSIISSDTRIDTSGHGGNIHIKLQGNIALTGSEITSTVLGNAESIGGNIDLDAKNISINQNSSITVATQSNGHAGNLSIEAKQIHLNNGGTLDSSTSFGYGAGGEIMIDADNIFITKQGLISSASNGEGLAGNIIIKRGDLLVSHSKIETSSQLGNGGNIEINTGTLVMNGGFIQANAPAQNAQGGKITVNANQTLASQGKILSDNNERHQFNPKSSLNVIQAAAPDGVSGQVNLNTVEINIAGQLAKVDSNFTVRQPIAHDPCSVARNKQTSSLIQKGQGGLPSNAGDNIHLPLHRYRSKELPKPQTKLAPANKKIPPHSTPDLCKKRKN